MSTKQTITRTERLDQLVIAFDDNEAVRGAHVSKLVTLRDGSGALVSASHETVPFDAAQLESVIPNAPQIARIAQLERQLATAQQAVEDHAREAAAEIGRLNEALSAYVAQISQLTGTLDDALTRAAAQTANIARIAELEAQLAAAQPVAEAPAGADDGQ